MYFMQMAFFQLFPSEFATGHVKGRTVTALSAEAPENTDTLRCPIFPIRGAAILPFNAVAVLCSVICARSTGSWRAR